MRCKEIWFFVLILFDDSLLNDLLGGPMKNYIGPFEKDRIEYGRMFVIDHFLFSDLEFVIRLSKNGSKYISLKYWFFYGMFFLCL